MTLLLLGVSIALATAGWVIHPLLNRRWQLASDATSAEILNSQARKRVALAALKEAEYDHAAGKLDDQDYAELRQRLEREALQALRAAEQDPSGAERAARPRPSGPQAHSCGFVNPDGSRFCAGCGTHLG